MKKILLIRFSSIGDIVLTTPVIRTIKKKFPNAELHFLTKKSFEGLVSENPYLSKIITLNSHWEEMISQLKFENYDVIIDLHKNLRSKKVAFSLKKTAYSFQKLNIKKWLWVNFKWNLMPQKHLVDRYFEGLKKLDLLDDGEGLDFFLPKNFLWNNGIDIPSQFVVYAIGGTFTTKKMPFEKMSELLQNTQNQVILIGGKEDVEIGKKLAQKTNCINLCGLLSIHESAFLISKADAVITHDTGMMHIACAFRKKVITLWGNTHPLLGFYPYFPKSMNENQIRFDFQVDLSCRPCSKLGKNKCPKGHFNCMRLQPIEKIRKVAEL
jgi:ADP-heptose:LPS heptosyltransferase